MTSPRIHQVVSVAAVAVITCALLPAAGQAQDALAADEAERHTDEARTLFGEGVALVAERRFEEAEAKFRDALALHDAPSIRANLASALLEQGEYPEAVALATGVAADASAPDEVRQTVRLLLDQVAARAGYVRTAPVDTSGQVAIDAWTVTDPTSETPVSAGSHVATLTLDGEERARTPFEIATGDHLTVSLDVVPSALEEVVAAPPPEPAVTETWWFWTAVGGGVVLVAIVVGVGVGVGTSGSVVEPALSGDFEPGVLRW